MFLYILEAPQHNVTDFALDSYYLKAFLGGEGIAQWSSGHLPAAGGLSVCTCGTVFAGPGAPPDFQALSLRDLALHLPAASASLDSELCLLGAARPRGCRLQDWRLS